MERRDSSLTRCCWRILEVVQLELESIDGECDKRLVVEERNFVRGAGTGGIVDDAREDRVDVTCISTFFSDRLYVPGSKTGGYSSSPVDWINGGAGAGEASLGVSVYGKRVDEELWRKEPPVKGPGLGGRPKGESGPTGVRRCLPIIDTPMAGFSDGVLGVPGQLPLPSSYGDTTTMPQLLETDGLCTGLISGGGR